jgi:lysophospholipase L1-like esterase
MNLFGQYDNIKQFSLYHTCFPDQDIIKVNKLGGVKRIIFLGGSAAEGCGVKKRDTFTSLLQVKLDSFFKSRKYEVVNAAVGGYTSYQLLVYFEEAILKLAPDMVILYAGYNDSGYPGTMSDAEYLRRIKKLALKIKDNDDKRKRLFKYGLLSANPVLCLLAESRLFGYLYLHTFDPVTGGNKIFPFTHRVPQADQEYVLKRFIDLSKKYNFRLILIPEAMNWNMSGRVSLNFYFESTKRIAEENNTILINILDLINKYPAREIFIDDVHLTDFGHSLIAERLFELLRSMDSF